MRLWLGMEALSLLRIEAYAYDGCGQDSYVLLRQANITHHIGFLDLFEVGYARDLLKKTLYCFRRMIVVRL